MHCENCGSKLEDDSKYCDSCGARMTSAAPQTGLSFESSNVGPEPKTFLFIAVAVGLVVTAVIAGPGMIKRMSLITGTNFSSSAWTRVGEHLTPQQMIEQINGFCHDLDAMAGARKIGAMEVFNYCGNHSTYAAMALSSDPEHLKPFYESARDDYRAIKARAGFDPNVTIQQMEQVKAPSQTLGKFRAFHQFGGSAEEIPGYFTIRDTEYEFLADGHSLANEVSSAYAQKISFSTLTSAQAEQAERGTLVESYVFGCVMRLKPDGHTDWYHTYFTQDQQGTVSMCNTVNAAIQEFNRRHPNVY